MICQKREWGHRAFKRVRRIYRYKNTHDHCIFLAPVVQKLDSAMHRINHSPVDNAIGFPVTYPLYSDLSGGWRYPTFEQLGPSIFVTQRAFLRD